MSKSRSISKANILLSLQQVLSLHHRHYFLDMSHLTWDPTCIQGPAAINLWAVINRHKYPRGQGWDPESWVPDSQEGKLEAGYQQCHISPTTPAQCFIPFTKEDPQRYLQVYLHQPSPSRALSRAGHRAGLCQQQGSGCARTPSHHADSSASLFLPAAICFLCLILRWWQSCCEAAHHLPSCSHSTYQQHGMLRPEQGPEVLQQNKS